MTPVDRLLAIEEIKALKARYFRTLDAQDWPAYAAVFAEAGVLEVESLKKAADGAGAVSRRETGRDAIAAWISAVLKGAVTVHHGHMPEIEITSDDGARAIWAMEDRVDWPDKSIHGWGHYHETYVREDGAWKIASSRLTRIRVDVRSGAGEADPARLQMLDAGG